MSEIITLANQKGGCGKTSTAAALYSGLTLRGFKVLGLDLDPQANFSFIMQAGSNSADIVDVLAGNVDISEAVEHTERGDFIAASKKLSAVDMLITGKERASLLKRALKPVAAEYDFVIIDTPPDLGTITINALVASTGLIIPTFAEIFSVQGVLNLFDMVKSIQTALNSDLINRGILITRHRARVRVQRETAAAIKQVAERAGVKVFSLPIRDSVIITEAASLQRDVFSYQPKSKVALDYAAFVDELLKDLSL